ncbi:MAG TPA: hypothetical protein VIU62_08275 [Chloroflexota bacterium]
MDAINNLFTNLLNIGTQVGVAVAAVFLMWGAYMYMFAAGNPHRMERGTSAMWCAVVGLVMVVSARIIAGMIRTAIGA